MLGILGESYLVASRADGFRHDRRPRGVIDSPAAHDPERQWIDEDRRRRRARGDPGHPRLRRRLRAFLRRQRTAIPATCP